MPRSVVSLMLATLIWVLPSLAQQRCRQTVVRTEGSEADQRWKKNTDRE